jgi:hypothetical protein
LGNSTSGNSHNGGGGLLSLGADLNGGGNNGGDPADATIGQIDDIMNDIKQEDGHFGPEVGIEELF